MSSMPCINRLHEVLMTTEKIREGFVSTSVVSDRAVGNQISGRLEGQFEEAIQVPYHLVISQQICAQYTSSDGVQDRQVRREAV